MRKRKQDFKNSIDFFYLPDDEDESLEFEECLLRFFFFFDDSLAVSLL